MVKSFIPKSEIRKSQKEYLSFFKAYGEASLKANKQVNHDE
jgi:hypothetical protein